MTSKIERERAERAATLAHPLSCQTQACGHLWIGHDIDPTADGRCFRFGCGCLAFTSRVTGEAEDAWQTFVRGTMRSQPQGVSAEYIAYHAGWLAAVAAR